MRDSKMFIDNHSLKGQTILYEGVKYVLGSILQVNNSRRLYIEMNKDGKTLNVPLHKVAKKLFEEAIF